MAVKNTKAGGTDWSDGDVLYAADLNDTFDVTVPMFYSDHTKSSTTNEAETTIASFTVPQNDLGSNGKILLNATFARQVGGTTAVSTWRLKHNGSVLTTGSQVGIGDSHTIMGALTYAAEGIDTSAGSAVFDLTVEGGSPDNRSAWQLTGLGYQR